MSDEKKKYECLGGPLCGRMEEPIKSEIGIPAFAYDDSDGKTHYYRLAKSKSRGHYWHYLGTAGVDKNVRPFLRPGKKDS